MHREASVEMRNQLLLLPCVHAVAALPSLPGHSRQSQSALLIRVRSSVDRLSESRKILGMLGFSGDHPSKPVKDVLFHLQNTRLTAFGLAPAGCYRGTTSICSSS